MAILLTEYNVISLRTALVMDNGSTVYFCLMPADLTSHVPEGRKSAPKDFDWVLEDSTWLYRHPRSADKEAALMHGCPVIEQGIKPLALATPPEFKLLWTDSGHGVALYLNGEPWAFIDEQTHRGFSKGILSLPTGNSWDQKLFEKLFGNE